MNDNDSKFTGFDSVTPSDGTNPEPLAEQKPNEEKQTFEAPNIQQNIPQTPKTYENNETTKNIFPSGNYYSPQKSQQSNIPRPFYDPMTGAPLAEKKSKPSKAPRSKKSYGIGSLIAVALIVAVVMSGIFSGIFMLLPKLQKNATNPETSSTSDFSGESQTESEAKTEIVYSGSIEQLAINASQIAGKSVVGIQTTFGVQSFFGGESTYEGAGSGVIYREDGYIVTNYHVIEETLDASNSKITVFLDNDVENGYEAQLVNYNIACDLAVLKIDKTGLNAIKRGDSDQLKTGQYVVAIGSPGGLDFIGSTTFGIVSGLNRTVSTSYGDMALIQTDAAINPGNSGGALVNATGELVGICNSKYVSTDIEGMGFAIPVNKVVEICDKLIKNENMGEPYLGIAINSNYTSDVLSFYGYPAGAVVASVDEGSPAHKAGLSRSDIITKVGTTKISEPTDFFTALSTLYPGDEIEISFFRSGKTKTVKLTVGKAN